MTSPGTCAGKFSYPGASLTSLSTSSGWPGLNLTIYGTGFNPSASAKFQGVGASTTYVSPKALATVIPGGFGPGTPVQVTVTESVGPNQYTSNGLTFTYGQAASPWVTSVYPTQGPAGTFVGIKGANFQPGAMAFFGAVPSATMFVASNLLLATAPPGSGTANVTVVQSGLTSSISCGSHFTYGASPPSGTPAVWCVYPLSGPPGSPVDVYGANLTHGSAHSYVSFGGVPATASGTGSPGVLVVAAALGNGTVPLVVTTSIGSSPICPQASFLLDYPSPIVMPVGRTESLLPPAYSAAPLGWGRVLASDVVSGKIVLYTWGGSGYASTPLAPFNMTLGSEVFDQLGSTHLYSENGTPGQVAFAGGDGSSLLLGVFTSDSGGRTVAETISSSDGGTTWSGPYLVGSNLGSVSDPEAWSSPSGYIYVTFRENGGDLWQVDQAVYGPSGRLVQTPQAVPGSGGSTGYSAGPPTLTVDDFNRPLYAWAGWSPSLGNISEYTGEFLPGKAAVAAIASGFANTTSPDFLNFGQPALRQFRASVVNVTNWLQANITGNHLCHAQQDAFYDLYTNDTTFQPSPLVWGPNVTGCIPLKKIDRSLLANTTGPMTPDVYLFVATDILLEALGVGIMPAPDVMLANLSISMPPNGGGTGLFAPGQSGSFTDPQGDSALIQPVAITPIDVWLNTSSRFATYDNVTRTYSQGRACGSTTLEDLPAMYWTNVSTGSSVGNFPSAVAPPSVFLLNLSSQTTGNWQASVTATYNATETVVSCSGTTTTTPLSSLPAGWPTRRVLSLSGTWETGLSPYPWNLAMNSTPISVNRDVDTLHWTNTMEATAAAWLNYTSNYTNAASWGSSKYRVNETIPAVGGFAPVLTGQSYLLTVLLQSRASGKAYNTSWNPQLNTNQFYTAYPQTVYFSCTFTQLSNPATITWNPSTYISNVSSTTATITWFTTGQGVGWVTYNDSFGYEYTQTAQVIHVGNSYEYVAQLHGLEPWGAYNVTAHVKVSAGCTPQSGLGIGVYLAYANTGPTWSFNTAAIVPLMEQDYPYDSITHEGGGAAAFWQVPTDFTVRSSFLNGSLTFTNRSNTSSRLVVQILPPLSPAQAAPSGWLGASWLNTTYQINVTGLSLNTSYRFDLELNYSITSGPMRGRTITGLGQPYNFTYERDTSGDGLTDWEKVRGWSVTARDQWGSSWSKVVTASPNLWATNGLVNDYVEKRFALDPSTIDTAGSHMLDTWNLTFELGTVSSSPTCPVDFRCWYENGTNPFTKAPYPGGVGTGTPVSSNSTGPHTQVEDSSAYDASVYWTTHSDLSYLQNLVNTSRTISSQGVGWLRAMMGTYGTHRTLTVWGKLSWGANPLAASTPGTWLTDGNRVNPLGATDLQVTITAWSDSGLTGGNGVAAYVYAYADVGLYSYVRQGDYSGYTQQTTVAQGQTSTSFSGGSSGNIVISFPVLSVNQTSSLNLSLVQNTGTNGGNTFAVAVACSRLSVDLELQSLNSAPSCTSSSASLTYEYQVIWVYSRAPTWIELPTDNTTVSALPLGLQHYTGEQNFVLLVVNDTVSGSGSLPVNGIPYSDQTTGTYSLALSYGLNNLLIPRSIFINSPLGQALLSDTTGSITARTHNQQGPDLRDHWQWGGQGSEWFNRITGANTSVQAGQPGYIEVVSNDTSQSCVPASQCGGVPANGGLESGLQSRAVQAIFTLNESTSGDLEALIGGLVLNWTGNFTGWLFGATTVLPSLGLLPAVMNDLGNQTLVTSGEYGPPVSSTTQSTPLPWWEAPFASAWNAVCGALSTVWSAALSAATYIRDLGSEAAALGLKALQQIGSVLSKVAAVILAAAQAVINAIIAAAKAIFAAMVSLVEKALHSYLSGVVWGLRGAFAAFSSSTATLGQQFDALAQFLLNLTGLNSFISPIMNALQNIMSVVQPVLNLLNPLTLIQTLGSVIESGLGPNPISDAINTLNQLLLGAFGVLTNGISSLLLFAMTGANTIAVRSSQYASVVANDFYNVITGAGSNLGNPSYTSWFGNSLSQGTNAATIADCVHMAADMALIMYLAFSARNAAIQGSKLYDGMFYATYQVLYGGSDPSPPQAYAGLGTGLAITLISTLLEAFMSPADHLYVLALAAFGTAFTIYTTAKDWYDFVDGGPPAETVALISVGASIAAPILLADQSGF